MSERDKEPDSCIEEDKKHTVTIANLSGFYHDIALSEFKKKLDEQ